MTNLADEGDVFTPATGATASVLCLAKRLPGVSPADRTSLGRDVADVLADLAEQGWLLSTRAMFDPTERRAWVYDSGFAHDVDVIGVFEAPTVSSALAGIANIESAGWGRLFASEWVVGLRELAPVPSPAPGDMEPSWGFVALWEWNDAWQAATPAERTAYDAECDVAFASDLQAGIDISGRHRLDWATSWHHLGVWEAPTLETIDSAMREHERVADFKFTTSRHFIGRRRPLLSVLGVSDV